MEGGGQIPTKASFTLQINDIFNEEKKSDMNVLNNKTLLPY